MKVKAVSVKLRDVSPTLAIPMIKEGDHIRPALEIGEELEGVIRGLLGREFRCKLEEVYSFPIKLERGPERMMLIGLGEKKELNLDSIRRGYGRSALLANEMGLEKISAAIPRNALAEDYEEIVEAITEGVLLSTYRFDKYKSEKEEIKLKLFEILVGGDVEKFQRVIDRAESICKGVKIARDIANTPSSDCTPERFVELAKESLAGLNVAAKIYGLKELEEMGMGGIVSVGRGSSREPKLLVLEYNGVGGEERPYIIAGKAVTFDSGGISIKPSEKLEEMKYDKSGGAAVVGIVASAALLRLPIRLIGLIPIVENMPGGNAYKPGDIVRFRNGKTAEIISTDAEGRLILADALAYGSEFKPKAMIDLATLTRACVIALGTHASGLFSNDDSLVEKLLKIGEKTGERLWRLPLWKPYYNQLKSEVSDMKNTGGRPGGAITAAAFLSRFVKEGIPWAHIDIAGTAWTQETTEEKSYNPKGATGVGVRLIIHYLINEASKKPA